MAHFLASKNDSTKKKITTLVKQYILENPEEYKIVKDGIAMKRSLTRNQYASLEGSKEMRALFEIPETLSIMFIMGLDEEETIWFKSKPGSHWFTRTFSVFALPDAV